MALLSSSCMAARLVVFLQPAIRRRRSGVSRCRQYRSRHRRRPLVRQLRRASRSHRAWGSRLTTRADRERAGRRQLGHARGGGRSADACRSGLARVRQRVSGQHCLRRAARAVLRADRRRKPENAGPRRATFAGVLAYDDERNRTRIGAPTLLLWGDHDALFSGEDQQRLPASISGATLKVYAETGHCPNWERPQAVATDIQTFMALNGLSS